MRNQGDAERDYLSGYQSIGVILSFAAVVLLFGAGLVLLCLPYLTVVAEIGYGVLRTVAAPFGPILVRILRFIFFPGRSLRADAPTSNRGNEGEFFSLGETSWWGEFLEKVLAWGLVGVGGDVFYDRGPFPPTVRGCFRFGFGH